MATVKEILDVIRDNASDLYIERVPEYTSENLLQIGDAITSEKNVMNEFIDSLVNKVMESNIKSRLYKNPLAKLKGKGIPMGSTIEEIFVNPAVDSGFSSDGNLLLKQVTPDTKVAYYSMNRKGEYQASFSKPALLLAFNSEENFMSFYNGIVTSVYSGDEIDEFILTKNVIGKTIDNGGIQIVNATVDEPRVLAKAIGKMSKAMLFPSKNLCGYNLVNKDSIESGKETECITFTPQDAQCIIMTADAQTEIDYEYLANVYNIEVATLKAMTILVDEIPSDNYNIHAVLCDVDCIQMRDNYYAVENFYNPSNSTDKIFLHHWETLYFSMFGNAVAFGTKKSVEESAE